MWEVSSDCHSELRPFLLSESLLFPKGKSVLGHAWIWNNINNMGRKDSIYATLMWAQQQGQEQSQRRPGSSSSRIYRGGHRHTALFGAVSLLLPFSHLEIKSRDESQLGTLMLNLLAAEPPVLSTNVRLLKLLWPDIQPLLVCGRNNLR